MPEIFAGDGPDSLDSSPVHDDSASPANAATIDLVSTESPPPWRSLWPLGGAAVVVLLVWVANLPSDWRPFDLTPPSIPDSPVVFDAGQYMHYTREGKDLVAVAMTIADLVWDGEEARFDYQVLRGREVVSAVGTASWRENRLELCFERSCGLLAQDSRGAIVRSEESVDGEPLWHLRRIVHRD